MKKPNIVLILTDQMRKDCIGFLNEHPVETPYLDMMKKNGFFFSNAYAAVPSCIASRAAIMTGLSQKTHGFTGFDNSVKWEYPVTMAGTFADAGYHTQLVGKMHALPERNLVGYHNVMLHDGYLHITSKYGRKASETFTAVDDYLLWLKRELGVDKTMIDNGLECIHGWRGLGPMTNIIIPPIGSSMNP
jgi:arylsulfatase A-like enzyme